MTLQLRRLFFMVVMASAALVVLSGCNGGLRPTLVQDQPTPTPPQLQIEVPGAPEGVPALMPASVALPLQATADDALLAWATEQAVPYLDACSRSNPEPGQLCDIPTDRDTVRLLGPNPGEIWYIVEIESIVSFDLGTGFRVTSVAIPGN